MNRVMRSLSLCGATTVTLASWSAYAGLPSHGHFVSGQGQIGKVGQSLTVKQSSTTGIINWNSFSVGGKNSVSFDNGSGATLNRVTGGNLSAIAGQLHATGTLYLMNSSGVIVSGTGHVTTGGSFVATSGNIVNIAFGTEDEKHRTATAAVINHGTIIAGGRAALFGSTVTNTGSITGAFVALRGNRGTAAGGTIRATGNASHNGRVLIISKSGETKITGGLSARNADGTGGHIETSGQHVAIGGTIDAGKGGNWLVDPVNLTVDAEAASTIDASLNKGTNVTLQTTKTGASGPGATSSGPGDIIVSSALSWSSSAQLSLEAYHSVLIDAHIAVAGSGRLGLIYGGDASGGGLAFDKGSISFANTSDIFGINRTQYKLVGNIKTLAADIAADPNGDYALAGNYDAQADGSYALSPIATMFDGTFNGLGNVISNLRIDNTSSHPTGLFAGVGSTGSVRSVSLSAVNIVGIMSVGALAGVNNGDLVADKVSGAVNGTTYVGGLAGTNTGTIASDISHANVVNTHGTKRPGTTGSLVGDLVGFNEDAGIIQNAVATGNVAAINSSDVGGLAGRNEGTVKNSHASGKIHGYNSTGGLVGNNLDLVEQSWASGRVQGMRYVGGLVGYSDTKVALTEDSYASGNVIADVGGKDEGGLIGLLNGPAAAINCYAMGNVTGEVNAGGLVGFSGGSVSTSYSTGSVTGKRDIGGSIGEDAGKVSDAYWDTQTSGRTNAIGLLDQGATGRPSARTTAALRKSLPGGFSSAVWGLEANINKGFPYLIAIQN